MSQLIVQTPSITFNGSGTLAGLWYPTARPLKIWRKTLGTNDTTEPCTLAKPVFGTKLKNLNKKYDPCSPGSIMSFSGLAGIRPANTNIKPKYFQNNHQYLRNRGNTFETTSTLHKIPEVQYASGTTPVWPGTTQTLGGQTVSSASFAYNTATCNPAKYAIYKPNNSGFSKQGAVESSTRLLKLKYAERPELTQFQKKALRAQTQPK